MRGFLLVVSWRETRACSGGESEPHSLRRNRFGSVDMLLRVREAVVHKTPESAEVIGVKCPLSPYRSPLPTMFRELVLVF